MGGDSVKNWAERLRNAHKVDRTRQTQALLSAFSQIDDAVFREEIIVLLELIASKPALLAKVKSCQPNAGKQPASLLKLVWAR
jgi:hypothetical protein